MELRVTVGNKWEARLAWSCGVDQLDVRAVEAGASSTPSVTAIREVSLAAPDLPLCVLLSENLRSSAATALATVGAAATGATHVIVSLRGSRSPATATTRVRAAHEAAAEAGATVAVRVAIDAKPDDDEPTISDAPEIAAAGGAAGIVVETAYRKDRPLTEWCGLGELADSARRCHEQDLTCTVGGGITLGDLRALRGTGVDIVSLRGTVTTGPRIARLDPWMMCLAMAGTAGAPALRG